MIKDLKNPTPSELAQVEGLRLLAERNNRDRLAIEAALAELVGEKISKYGTYDRSSEALSCGQSFADLVAGLEYDRAREEKHEKESNDGG